MTTMILRELGSGLILDKPSGVATHTPDGGHTLGFLEMASKILDRPLWAVHRLDNGTSGCLLVTTSEKAVAEYSESLKSAKKKYIFISSRESKDSLWSVEGRIEKTGNHKFALVAGDSNSFTKFAKLGPCTLGFMYEAEINSGRTHQIRIHAQNSGIPILGDSEHGGDPFVRLMLHSHEIEMENSKTISPLPILFETTVPLPTKDSHKFLSSFDRRRFVMTSEKGNTNAFRLVHREWTKNKTPRLAVEKLGSVLHLMDYSNQTIQKEFIEEMARATQCGHWFVRNMNDREKIFSSNDLPPQWVIQESKVKFELKSNQGLSTGLFLDQRENRKRILENSQGKRVANFFSYTCGFSVVAALGGAHEVVSVDTSTQSLDWGKYNFTLNDLNPNQFEFFVADTEFFLKSSLKRRRQFDTIILDPPTFSRHKHGVFSLKKNFPEVLELAFESLAPKGTMLVTVNDETLSEHDLSCMIENSVQKTIKKLVRIQVSRPPYDFEFPLERESVMKGFWVSLEN